jgi:carboxymethylenebutenolidase
MPIQTNPFSSLRAQMRRFQPALLATLAAMALTACGGGGDEASDEAAVAEARQQLMAGNVSQAATASTVTMTKVSFTNSDGQALSGFLFRDPAAIPRQAAVVMLHGCSGVWSNGVVNTEPQPPQKALSHIHRRWGESLARAGYNALLVDSFTPRGLGNECGNGAAGLNEAVVRPRDALAGRAWLVQNGWVAGHRVALVGWSNGASATLATMERSNEGLAGSKPFQEAFAFYPGCGLINEFGGDASTLAKTTWLPYAPVTIHHATLDALYTDGRCANRVAGAIALGAGSASGNAVAMTAHAGARHSFDQIDLTKALAAPYTVQDQTAQATADTAVMNRLAILFPSP